MNFALAAQMGNSFFDTEQAEALRLFDIKSLTVVADGKYQALWLLLDPDSYGGGM